MNRPRLKSFILILALIAATGAAMAFSARDKKISPAPPATVSGSGPLTLSGHLVQTHVMKGSPGRVGLELVLSAAPGTERHSLGGRGIDLVVVLDRSGSMQGEKIDYARRALLDLIAGLTERDRLALFSYSDFVQAHGGLMAVNESNRRTLQTAVQSIHAGGATNLGGGLQAGIELIASAGRPGHPGRVILISDGLANRGVTDPEALARMAAGAAGKEFAVTTIGVGADFNEFLMTRIADHGAGSYYYLDNPAAFAETFQREFLTAASTAAAGIRLSLTLPPGVRIVEASGYPVAVSGETALLHPGSLRFGQTRRLFLTLEVPTSEPAQFALGRITASYRHGGETHEIFMDNAFTIACIDDEERVLSSIDRTLWERLVLNDDYNRLKQEVAAEISAGRADAARRRISAYTVRHQALNDRLGSAGVAQNLETEVKELERRVDETFQGPPAAVMEKQKSTAKSMQYEGYSNRRTP
jgi:Ca-activated chloride channel family protein